MPDDLTPFADALRLLTPQPPVLSRDALLFAAGKAAGRPRPWLWPSAAGAFAALSAVLAGFLASPVAPVVHYVELERIVYIERPAAERVETAEPTPPAVNLTASTDDESRERLRLLQVRRDVLRWGVEMLPESKPSAGPSPDVVARDLTNWLNLPAGTFALPAQLKTPAPHGEEDK